MSQNQETSVLAIIATVMILFTFYLFIMGVRFKYLRLFLKQGNNQTQHATIMLAIHELLEAERSLPPRPYRSSPFHTRTPHRNHSNRRETEEKKKVRHSCDCYLLEQKVKRMKITTKACDPHSFYFFYSYYPIHS